MPQSQANKPILKSNTTATLCHSEEPPLIAPHLAYSKEAAGLWGRRSRARGRFAFGENLTFYAVLINTRCRIQK